MLVLIGILCFFNGALMGVVFMLLRRDVKSDAKPEDEDVPPEVLKQWANFYKYDGTTRGQKELDED